MTRLLVLGVLMGSTVLAAQQPVLPETSLPQPAQQPVVRRALAVAGEPIAPARGWALSPEAAPDADVPGLVSRHGPGARIAAAQDVTVFRPAWTVTGEFAVSAIFQPQAASAVSAAYGLTLGGQGGLAFLIRADETFAIQGLSGMRVLGGSWAAVARRMPTAGELESNHLEVRVRAMEAEFLVNGEPVAVVPIDAGQLDGPPGVHVEAQGDVAVVGFSVQRATALLQPGAGR